MANSNRASRIVVFTVILLFSFELSGCDLLEVDNPNNLVEDDLQHESAAPALANGALATVTSALGSALGPYSVASDEISWIGTRDGWEQLQQGNLSDRVNEFSDGAFQSVAEARWTADEAIKRLKTFDDEGRLGSPTPLIRSYTYAAIIYLAIADQFDDFALSDRREAAPAIGEDNMHQLYTTAVGYLDEAISRAELAGETEWVLRARALRARAHHGKEVWHRLNPVDTAAPLARSPEAVADAEDVLAQVSPEWRFDLDSEPGTPSNSLAGNVNQRQELRLSDVYIFPGEDGTSSTNVRLRDPIDEVKHPELERIVERFISANQYASITVVSARELQLIRAETALAEGDESSFTEHINELRSWDGLSPYEGQLDARTLLINSRQANLYLQGRRLADQYRFEQPSPEWTSAAEPGRFLPITSSEIRSNPHIDF